MKPSDMILVSLVGPLRGELNPVVIVGDRKDYEWWWVRGLDICVFTNKEADWRRHLMDISAQRPAKLAVWDVERGSGAWVYRLPTLASLEAPTGFEWELQFVKWLPFQNEDFIHAPYRT